MLLTKLIDKNTVLNKCLGKKVYVTGLSNDSRHIKKGILFAAIKGEKYDGINFVDKVINSGASTILCSVEGYKKIKNQNINLLVSNNIRLSLSSISKKFYPKQPNNIVAITGTNGKTSIAYFLNLIWKKSNLSSATIGTLGIKYRKETKNTGLTTPDPITLHKQLNSLKKNKINYIAIEASSHALDQHRLDAVRINCAVYTNLSRDHLDYHKNVNNYFLSKKRLFSELLKNTGIAIINIDDKYGAKIREVCLSRNIKIITYGNYNADWHIIKTERKKLLTKVYIKNKKNTFQFNTPIFARFQLENLLCSIIIAKTYGINMEKILKHIRGIPSPPGRLKKVSGVKPRLNIFVDYAHTPKALEICLLELKNIIGPNGKIIVLFGCGGNRDKGKRRLMAMVAKKHADLTYVTDDNPRYENANEIRRELVRYCSEAINIPNRRNAIIKAINQMNVEDILLIAGKGHEKYQDVKGKKIAFDDAIVAKEAAFLRSKK